MPIVAVSQEPRIPDVTQKASGDRLHVPDVQTPETSRIKFQSGSSHLKKASLVTSPPSSPFSLTHTTSRVEQLVVEPKE